MRSLLVLVALTACGGGAGVGADADSGGGADDAAPDAYGDGGRGGDAAGPGADGGGGADAAPEPMPEPSPAEIDCDVVTCHFVRAGATGASDGSSWTDAWAGPGDIAWDEIAPGDAIWLAGGSYTSGFETLQSGSATAWISILRATVVDDQVTAVAGWDPSFDAPVVIETSAGLRFSEAGRGSYLLVDGRTRRGMRLRAPCTSFDSDAVFFGAGGMHDIVLANLDLAGPGGATPYPYEADCSVLAFRTSIGGGGDVSYLTVRDSELHGGPNLVYNLGANHHVTFVRTRFYDNGSATDEIHANMVYTSGGNHDWTFGNCEFFNWQVEGINLYQQTNHPHTIYGSVFHSPMDAGARVFWLAHEDGAPTGPLFLYNNTFVGVAVTIDESRASPATADSIARNNLYWDASFADGSRIADDDYAYGDGALRGAHSLGGAADPFVDRGRDFRLAAGAAAAGAGVALDAAFARDGAGATRGEDGAWDIGAFER